MAGLNLGIMASAGNGYTSSTTPQSATEAGFGTGSTMSGSPSGLSACTPNDPFGVALWTGVGALALLLVIRHSLPA